MSSRKGPSSCTKRNSLDSKLEFITVPLALRDRPEVVVVPISVVSVDLDNLGDDPPNPDGVRVAQRRPMFGSNPAFKALAMRPADLS